jgi:uncharacterized membrane protein
MHRKQQARVLVAVLLLVVLILFTSIRTSPIRCTNCAGTAVQSSILKQRQFVASDPSLLIPLLALIGLIVIAHPAAVVLDSVPLPSLLLCDSRYNRPPPNA